jgi:AcrR family transcriptional regulator
MRSGGGPGGRYGDRRDERNVHRTRSASPGRAGRRHHRAELDARQAKGEQTRRALLEALVAIADEGTTRPTLPAVAHRAGVSVRTVYHHFTGVRQLLEAGVYLQTGRRRSMLFTILPLGPPEVRIAALCRQRRFYFEAVTPIRRLALSRSTAGTFPGADRAFLADQLAYTLEPELQMRGARSPHLLDALEHAMGWDAWNGLRDGGAHTAPRAERVMELTATSLLARP